MRSKWREKLRAHVESGGDKTDASTSVGSVSSYTGGTEEHRAVADPCEVDIDNPSVPLEFRIEAWRCKRDVSRLLRWLQSRDVCFPESTIGSAAGRG